MFFSFFGVKFSKILVYNIFHRRHSQHCERLVMRKIISILYSFLLMTSIFVSSSSSSFATAHFVGGDGSSSNPYLIKTAEQLHAMRNEPDAHYALLSDIDVSELIGDQENPNPLFNNGLGWLPIGSSDTPFTGFLDGRGYAITGLFIHIQSDYDSEVLLGLFGVLDQAFIYNLDVDAHFISESSQRFLGGVLAHTAINSMISGVKVTGSITSSSTHSDMIGGIIGSVVSSTLINVDGNVKINVSSQGFVGGLVGHASSSTITNGINRGDIGAHNSDHTGGIVGFGLDTSLHYLQNNGNVSSRGIAGGIIGGGEYITLSSTINRGDILTQGLIAGAIAGDLRYVLGVTSSSSVSQRMLINYGHVSSTQSEESLSLGLIGRLRFDVERTDFRFYVNDLINMSTSMPFLVGTVQDDGNEYEMQIIYSGIRATNTEILFDSYSPSKGSILFINNSETIDLNNLDQLATEINSLGLDLHSEARDSSLVVHFAQLYYFTQGKLSGAINNYLVFINTSLMYVLPGSTITTVPLFEEFAEMVGWDFSEMIGWNTKQNDTGTLYRPSDALEYKEGEVFVRVFSTSSEAVEIINEVNNEDNNEDNNEETQEENDEEVTEENNEENSKENDEEVNEEIKEEVVDEPDEELEKEVEEEILPDTSDTSFYQYLYLILGFSLLLISKKK